MANITIVFGSVSGNAKGVAEQAVTTLTSLGHTATLAENPTAELLQSDDLDALLICTSTTGQGDIPQNLIGLYIDIQDKFPMMNEKHVGVIALGNSSYSNFCGAGAKFIELMEELQAKSLLQLTIDATETRQPKRDAIRFLEEWSEMLK